MGEIQSTKYAYCQFLHHFISSHPKIFHLTFPHFLSSRSPLLSFLSFKAMKTMQQGRRFLKKLKFNPTNTKIKGLVFHLNVPESPYVKDRKHKEPETDILDPEEHPSLSDFEEKCPPGGENSVIFYTTSLRGIRKTFEDCTNVRFLLNSFKITIQERDVSMDMGYREELWEILGGRVIPPKVFVKGRYIGGADEIIGLHERGELKKLLEEVPSNGGVVNNVCNSCANLRFLICTSCNGSRKVYEEKDDDDHHHKEDNEFCIKKCNDCNENGLVKCPFCC
ncbi:hypothetical protein J1N35_024145 [Gossypium stocksii]|uniref:Glutaredoxin domain-containing protein n=1 Tax=Gossypium stocksii TaxID=47602 RepID=A0A9D4A4Y1_9ROSI|nr:hypothetical protein J1N35_024145 [Gossypium stocksii]